jgi:hypothetical protein
MVFLLYCFVQSSNSDNAGDNGAVLQTANNTHVVYSDVINHISYQLCNKSNLEQYNVTCSPCWWTCLGDIYGSHGFLNLMLPQIFPNATWNPEHQITPRTQVNTITYHLTNDYDNPRCQLNPLYLRMLNYFGLELQQKFLSVQSACNPGQSDVEQCLCKFKCPLTSEFQSCVLIRLAVGILLSDGWSSPSIHKYTTWLMLATCFWFLRETKNKTT